MLSETLTENSASTSASKERQKVSQLREQSGSSALSRFLFATPSNEHELNVGLRLAEQRSCVRQKSGSLRGTSARSTKQKKNAGDWFERRALTRPATHPGRKSSLPKEFLSGQRKWLRVSEPCLGRRSLPESRAVHYSLINELTLHRSDRWSVMAVEGSIRQPIH